MKFISQYELIEIKIGDLQTLSSMHCENTHELPPKPTCMDMDLGGCCNSCAARNIASKYLPKVKPASTSPDIAKT